MRDGDGNGDGNGAPQGAQGDEPGIDRIEIRLVERRDAEEIRDLYNHYVTESTALFDLVPRTLDDQVRWIDEHSGGHPAVVALLGGRLVGFGSLTSFRSRPAYATTVEDSVYVAPGHEGRGVGRLLLEALVGRARDHGFHTVIARIAGSNEASIGLHEACGFTLVGVEREVGRKFGRWIDVVEMQRML
jgi:phosphinothricin acetyltransferase